MTARQTLFFLLPFLLISCGKGLPADAATAPAASIKPVPAAAVIAAQPAVPAIPGEEAPAEEDPAAVLGTEKQMERNYGWKFGIMESKLVRGVIDTALFPRFFKPLDSLPIVLKATKDNLYASLTIQRKSNALIHYKLELIEFGQANYVGEGVAKIDAGAFKAYATDPWTVDTPVTGYLCAEYTDRQKGCLTYIRIAGEAIKDGSPLLAKIQKNCNGKIREITLEDFPVLVEK